MAVIANIIHKCVYVKPRRRNRYVRRTESERKEVNIGSGLKGRVAKPIFRARCGGDGTFDYSLPALLLKKKKKGEE